MGRLRRFPDRYGSGRRDPSLEEQQQRFQQVLVEAPEEMLLALRGMPVEYYRASNIGPGRFVPAILVAVTRAADQASARLTAVPQEAQGEWPTIEVSVALLRIAPGIHPHYQSYMSALRFQRALRSTSADPEALNRADAMVERSFAAARRTFEVGYGGQRPDGAPVSLGDLRAPDLWGFRQ